ncbi:MAG: hypothetical protein QUV19_14480 [Alteromonas macleodii]|jgi:hypothetical protein|uniref:hypothetical protein n=1 Tax=Alteromonas TaxID=226 RepID=UPI00128007AD|nr:hypothetical protein [Alteromonas macleodii]MDM7963477.1 hypothetical protein [Alteromonas macleodii]MDM8171778.1 hypothetical protein [Alteromonas macleodii]CAI3931295.1 hypothetical protein EZ55_00511 [Alteromonas macleodii]VTP52231.1 hypothetical protein EZ55_00511 [Alteromonas macleodii]|tara:strand:- start:6057 stop:6485 length:429 start_codon:yes stop_codon:yes gene_type:complete
MRFPKYGNYSLDVSGNVLEVFATGAWNLKTTEFFIEEMHELIAKFDNKPWAALMDGRRWVLSTPECQTRLAEAIKVNISRGLTRSAYVLDTGMVRWTQLERTHPSKHRDAESANYERDYFQKYFEALNWLHKEGFSPILSPK